MTYFDSHYSRVNDLSPEGRRRAWHDFERLYGPMLPPGRGARLLDFGCGAGVFLEWLTQARGYAQASGVDPDPGQVGFARSLGLEVALSEAPHEWLPGRGPFEIIFMLDVLEHLASDVQAGALRAARSALAPEGRLVVHVPNANSLFAGRYRYIDPTHVRSYTEVSLAAVLREAGFAEVTVRGDDVRAPRSIAGAVRLALREAVRLGRRIEAFAELGPPGLEVPLSLNLVAMARPGPA